MPQPGPMDDLAEIDRRVQSMSDSIGIILDKQLKQLEFASAKFEIVRLQTEIEVLANDIKTIEFLERSRGEVPKVDDLHQQLAAMRRKLEELEAKYQQGFRKSRRWWQFWK